MEVVVKTEWQKIKEQAHAHLVQPFIDIKKMFLPEPKCPMNYTRKQEWVGRGGKVQNLKKEAVHQTLTLEKK